MGSVGVRAALTRCAPLLATVLLGAMVLAACGGGKAAAGGGACVAGQAGSATNIAVPQEPASGVAKISGACWAKIAPTPVSNVLEGVGKSAIPGGTPPSVQVAWNPQNLYVKCNVSAWPLYAAAGSKTWWQNDTCEFFVSGADGHGGAYGPTDTQVGITYNGAVNAGGHKLAHVSAMTGLAQVNKGKGYTTELIVPWAQLGVGKPAKGQQYEFDLGVDYGSASGQYVAYADLHGSTNHPCCSTAGWSQITLG